MTEAHVNDVVVTGLGREVRRRVALSAWAVLEELVARAHHDDGLPPVIEVGTTELGQSLGLSAEVTRSALRCLVTAGLVEREQMRSAHTNRFAGARYRIVGTTGLLPAPRAGIPSVDDPAADQPAAALPRPGGPHPDTRPGRARRARRREPTAQLDLPGLTTVADPAHPEQTQQQPERHLA